MKSTNKTSISSKSAPVVFLSVVWMKRYDGIPADRSDDPKTISGYTKEYGYGFEIFNFRKHQQCYYGYVQPAGKKGTINIERIGAAKGSPKISGITVVFVSTHPDRKKKYIIGWYENATVYRTLQPAPAGSNRNYMGKAMGFYVTAKAGDSVLLQEDERFQSGIVIPVARKVACGMGQSFVWYADKPQCHKLIQTVRNFILYRKNSDELGEESYQQSIQNGGSKTAKKIPATPSAEVEVTHKQFQRDPSVARKALENAMYKCMLEPKHKHFISKYNGNNYVEAHHLIPMCKQSDFKHGLDVEENIVALCPICHRMVHFGESNIVASMLQKLYAKKRIGLGRAGLNVTLDKILSYYM